MPVVAAPQDSRRASRSRPAEDEPSEVGSRQKGGPRARAPKAPGSSTLASGVPAPMDADPKRAGPEEGGSTAPVKGRTVSRRQAAASPPPAALMAATARPSGGRSAPGQRSPTRKPAAQRPLPEAPPRAPSRRAERAVDLPPLASTDRATGRQAATAAPAAKGARRTPVVARPDAATPSGEAVTSIASSLRIGKERTSDQDPRADAALRADAGDHARTARGASATQAAGSEAGKPVQPPRTAAPVQRGRRSVAAMAERDAANQAVPAAGATTPVSTKPGLSKQADSPPKAAMPKKASASGQDDARAVPRAGSATSRKSGRTGLSAPTRSAEVAQIVDPRLRSAPQAEVATKTARHSPGVPQAGVPAEGGQGRMSQIAHDATGRRRPATRESRQHSAPVVELQPRARRPRLSAGDAGEPVSGADKPARHTNRKLATAGAESASSRASARRRRA